MKASACQITDRQTSLKNQFMRNRVDESITGRMIKSSPTKPWVWNYYCSPCFEPVLLTTAWPRKISGRVLSSHSIVPSPRTVRPCSPWGGRWIGHWRTTWSTVCSSAPHSQAAEEAIPHLYKQEGKRPTSVRRRLSRTQAIIYTPSQHQII